MRRVFELRPRLATTLVATISVLIFFFFHAQKNSLLSIFLIEGLLGSIKNICDNC